MFYIIYSAYTPNTAATNRMLSFIKAFDKQEIAANLILINPDSQCHHLPFSYKNIKVTYLWKDFHIGGKRFILRRALNRIYRLIAYKCFLKSLKENDKVLLYDPHKMLKDLVVKQNIEVYHERTENPMVLPIKEKHEQNLYLQSCKDVKGLFVISTALKRFFEKKGVDENKIKIINMTVDPNRFENLKTNGHKEKYIVYCGNGNNNKDGLDELIKAFSITRKKHPDVKLYVIGPMPDKNDEAGNLKLIEQLGLKDAVEFKGIQPANRIPQILKDAMICALDRPDSLQAQNGFPTKLGEYLLSGTPVVVTKVGDIPLFLKNGQNAMLANERDAQDFSSKMNWILEHPKEAEIIGKKGANTAKEHFNSLIESKKIIKAIYKR